MAVISFVSADSWFVPKYEFRTLLEKAALYATDPDDQYALRQAIYMDGLHFQLKSSEETRRLAFAVEHAADELQAELAGNSNADQRDRQFSEALDVLKVRLHGPGAVTGDHD